MCRLSTSCLRCTVLEIIIELLLPKLLSPLLPSQIYYIFVLFYQVGINIQFCAIVFVCMSTLLNNYCFFEDKHNTPQVLNSFFNAISKSDICYLTDSSPMRILSLISLTQVPVQRAVQVLTFFNLTYACRNLFFLNLSAEYFSFHFIGKFPKEGQCAI